MNKETLLTIVLVGLVMVSAVQAVQLTTIGSQIESGELTGTGGSGAIQTSSGGSGSGTTIPSSLTDLPAMVGGC